MSSEAVSKPSVLDLKQEKLRSINRKQIIHSVVIISKLSTDLADKRDIGHHYEKIFKLCHTKYQGDGPTGILLIYPQHVVHLLEAPLELLQTIIIDLDKDRSLLQESRLLNFSSGLEQRFYPQWSVRVLNLPSLAKGETYQTTDPIEQTVSSSIEVLYKLGAQLSRLHQMELKRTLDSLPEKLPHLLLQQDILEYLVNHSDLNTPADYISRYCAPHFITLENELVWPMAIRLFPYD